MWSTRQTELSVWQCQLLVSVRAAVEELNPDPFSSFFVQVNCAVKVSSTKHLMAEWMCSDSHTHSNSYISHTYGSFNQGHWMQSKKVKHTYIPLKSMPVFYWIKSKEPFFFFLPWQMSMNYGRWEFYWHQKPEASIFWCVLTFWMWLDLAFSTFRIHKAFCVHLSILGVHS